MDGLMIPLWSMAIIFFMVAFAYSSVGLGGGSSYTALMAIAGVSILVIPSISLILNLVVTFVGSYHFVKQRHLSVSLLLPFLASSIPMSFIGGSLHLDPLIFQFILLLSLVLIAARIYLWDSLSLDFDLTNNQRIVVSLILGAILGLIAGIVGIGGGIYLVPLIIILNLGTLKQAAACAVIFVFLNSLSALLAKFAFHDIPIMSFWPLIIAVFLGGFIGSRISSSSLDPKLMEKILGGIILLAIVLLTTKLLS